MLAWELRHVAGPGVPVLRPGSSKFGFDVRDLPCCGVRIVRDVGEDQRPSGTQRLRHALLFGGAHPFVRATPGLEDADGHGVAARQVAGARRVASRRQHLGRAAGVRGVLGGLRLRGPTSTRRRVAFGPSSRASGTSEDAVVGDELLLLSGSRSREVRVEPGLCTEPLLLERTAVGISHSIACHELLPVLLTPAGFIIEEEPLVCPGRALLRARVVARAAAGLPGPPRSRGLARLPVLRREEVDPHAFEEDAV
mmetsp:Transcript_47734/g.153654  ORF Transcript_47734/g.153654 Transcript_47734/m.153654 type:complete len:253 (+) Transcript_47734:3736-4494(+)